MRAQTDSGEVAAAVLHVRRAGRSFPAPSARRSADMPFLLASPTKPMTASAVLWLRDRRELALTDAVTRYCRTSAAAIAARHHPPPAHAHVGTARHAAGEHRASPPARAPVGVRGSDLPTPLLFHPGEKVSYQSIGHPAGGGDRREGRGEPMPGFMARTMFNPLGMRQTSFGLGGRCSRIPPNARCRRPNGATGTGTARYWRNLASPWGGARATARDLGTFLEAFASHGRPRVADDHGARDARDADRRAAAKLRSGLAARAGRLRPDLLTGDVRPLRFDRHADLARSGHRPRPASSSRPDRPRVPGPAFCSPCQRSSDARAADDR